MKMESFLSCATFERLFLRFWLVVEIFRIIDPPYSSYVSTESWCENIRVFGIIINERVTLFYRVTE